MYSNAFSANITAGSGKPNHTTARMQNVHSHVLKKTKQSLREISSSLPDNLEWYFEQGSCLF